MTRKKEYSRLAETGCILCRHRGVPDTPAELHHIRNGGRREDAPVIPLCPEHHRGATGVHSLGSRGFVRVHGISEEELLKLTGGNDEE
jgi:hypothetical protein